MPIGEPPIRVLGLDSIARDSSWKVSVPLRLRELGISEIELAAQILGRGMRDNPSNVRAFDIPDEEQRVHSLVRFFRPVLCGLHKRGLIYGAYRDDVLAGVCGIARPGFCQPSMLEKLAVVPSVVFGNPLGAMPRILNWVGEWAHRDPATPHWHLGPVAVNPPFQGMGVGRAMLTAFCAHMDAYGAFSYLETDKVENVRFYKKFRFAVIAEAEVMGVRNWFMSRPA